MFSEFFRITDNASSRWLFILPLVKPREMGYLLVNMFSFCLTCLRRFNNAAFIQVLNMSCICVWYNLPFQDLYTLADAPGSPLKATIGHACSHPSFKWFNFIATGISLADPIARYYRQPCLTAQWTLCQKQRQENALGHSGTAVPMFSPFLISHPRATRAGQVAWASPSTISRLGPHGW